MRSDTDTTASVEAEPDRSTGAARIEEATKGGRVAAIEIPPGLETPDHVTWGEVRRHIEWPRAWQAIWHPHPIPGGALVIIRQPNKRMGRNFFTLLSWRKPATDDRAGELAVIKVDGNPALYVNAIEAREAIVLIAAQLRAGQIIEAPEEE